MFIDSPTGRDRSAMREDPETSIPALKFSALRKSYAVRRENRTEIRNFRFTSHGRPVKTGRLCVSQQSFLFCSEFLCALRNLTQILEDSDAAEAPHYKRTPRDRS